MSEQRSLFDLVVQHQILIDARSSAKRGIVWWSIVFAILVSLLTWNLLTTNVETLNTLTASLIGGVIGSLMMGFWRIVSLVRFNRALESWDEANPTQ